MLFIHDEILSAKRLNFVSHFETKNRSAKEIIEKIISNASFEYFYDSRKPEYDYKITITTKEELKEFMEFFKKHPFGETEYICIKRYNVNLKDTFEIINKYDDCEFVDHIYVEQLDKNEWVNYLNYSIIYDFLKTFEKTLPKNPTNMDIIINAYDYVKSREYFEEEDKKSLISKKFYTSVLSPYIVCAGFVKQFNCILKEYGIPCYEYQFKNKGSRGHDVSMVYIEGHGIYFFDITRDCFTRKDQSTPLKNESKYSGFMLPYTYYLSNKLLNDNFDKELLKNPKIMEIKKRYAKQQIENGKDELVNVFNEHQFEKAYLLQTLVDVDFELLKCDSLFGQVSNTKEMMTAQIYDALLKINNYFGPEINDVDLFIDFLINAKKNSDLKDNKLYYQKAVISKFLCNECINLSDSMEKINKKILT